jgi:hypothetical protein
MKCSHCGCIGFAYGGCCKRCRQPLTVQDSQSSSRSSSGARTRLPKPFGLLAMGAIFCGLIAGVVVVRAQLKKYFDPTPAYLEAMNKSGKFEQPVTVRVNQKPIPTLSLSTGMFDSMRTVQVAKAAYVLEALGLLTVSKTTSFSTADLGPIGPAYEIKNEKVEISLTEKGLGESANWQTTEEPYPMASEKALWWHVPIGSREITRVEFVQEPVPNLVDIVVHWRWHPNNVGEGFDCAGSIVGSLPKDTQDFVRSLGWNSQTEYASRARLSRVGSAWEVQYIDFPNETIK